MSLVRRLLPRFSLRTLLLFVLMVGAGGALWLRWEPWQVVLTLRPAADFMHSVAFSPNGKYILTHTKNGNPAFQFQTILWDRSGREVQRTEWSPPGNQQAAAWFTGDHILITSMPYMRCMQLIRMPGFKPVFPNDGVCKISFSSDFNHCAALHNGFTRHQATVASYDLRTGQKRAAWDFVPGSNSDDPLPRLSVSNDGTWILAVAHEYGQGHGPLERLYLCNSVTQEKRRVPIPDVPIENVFFSSDGSRFVVLAFKSFQIFDTATNMAIMDGSYDAWFQWSLFPVDYVQLNTNNRSSLLKLDGPQPSIETLPVSIAREPMSLVGQWLSWIDESLLTVRDLKTGADYSSQSSSSSPKGEMLWENPKLLMFLDENPSLLFDTVRRDFTTLHYGLSPDRKRLYENDATRGRIFRHPSREEVCTLPLAEQIGDIDWSPDSQQLIRAEKNQARVYQRVRSDEPGALWWEPALWLAIFFGGGFVWSLWVGVRARGGA